MPWKLDEYREARGEFLIGQGNIELKDQKYREAFYSLRVGVALSPKNREGRMLLAQFYVAWQRPDLARRILLDGLEYNQGDIEYLKALFAYLLQQQSDFELVTITTGLLATAGPTPQIDERIRLIASARATALFFRGNYDESEDTLTRFRLDEAPDGKLLLLLGLQRGSPSFVGFAVEPVCKLCLLFLVARSDARLEQRMCGVKRGAAEVIQLEQLQIAGVQALETIIELSDDGLGEIAHAQRFFAWYPQQHSSVAARQLY
jgi:hypothetical protein